MSCKNGIPYGTGPSHEEVAAVTEITPEEIPGAPECGTTEVERAQAVIDFFISIDPSLFEFAVALAGVLSVESRIKPWIYNKSEHKDGYSYKGRHAPNAQTFKYNGKEYYMDQENMMKFGYGKGIAQWSWHRVLTFRDWYNSGAGGYPTPGIPTMDENGVNITATSINTQIRFVWNEMGERTGELKRTIDSLKAVHTTTDKEKFEENIKIGVDAVLRGYENGSNKSFAEKKFIDKYTWAGGYSGSMKSRLGRAMGFIEAFKKEGLYSQYIPS